jgi:hypothetical protein
MDCVTALHFTTPGYEVTEVIKHRGATRQLPLPDI